MLDGWVFGLTVFLLVALVDVTLAYVFGRWLGEARRKGTRPVTMESVWRAHYRSRPPDGGSEGPSDDV